MKRYTHLTQEQRYHISLLRTLGLLLREIGDIVGTHKSTISRELRRNRSTDGYFAFRADAIARNRRRSCSNARRFGDWAWGLVETLLKLKFSPEQISGRLKQELDIKISHETI